jgi:hypothetical protein
MAFAVSPGLSNNVLPQDSKVRQRRRLAPAITSLVFRGLADDKKETIAERR